MRNIAYKNSDTTHVLVTDIDIFPDGIWLVVPIYPIASLYSSFLSLPQSLLDDPKQVIVLPHSKKIVLLNGITIEQILEL